MKILIFIETDVVVRHFLNTGAFSELEAHHDVLYVFPEPGNKRMGDIDPATLPLNAPYVHLQHHKQRTRLWKQLLHVDQIRLKPGQQNAVLRNIRRTTLGPKASLLYTALGLPLVWNIFKIRQHRLLATTPNIELNAFIDEQKPDAIVHPCVLEGLFLNDLIDVSQRKHIPLTVIMNSWDNPSTKRAMSGKPDWLLVWGEQTRHHAHKLAATPMETTIPFGAAQFDIYNDPPQISRENFLSAHGIQNDARILLYAGSSRGTDETAHLTVLDQAITDGRLGNTVILYRPHPWGNGGKNGNTILDQDWKHVVIESSMRTYLESVRACTARKFLSDCKVTHDVLSHVDAVISPLSTILLEAAMHSKPILCFLPQEDSSEHLMVDSKLGYLEDLFNLPDILIARSYDEFIPQCQALVTSCETPVCGQGLKESSEFFVKPFDESYAKRLLKFVEDPTPSTL